MGPLTIKNVSFSYGSLKVLNNVSCTIKPGTLTSVLGPNGGGKTTFLKLLLGLLKPENGEIIVDGRNISDAGFSIRDRARLMAYVPQKHNAVFSYPVIEVVALGRLPYTGLFCKLSEADYLVARNCLSQLGIAHLENRPYTAVSGGEQQLTLLARALAQQAQILILDEPIAGLDYGNQILLLEQLRSLAKSGITCIKTTHYPEHALWTSDDAIFLDNGEIIAAGKADEIITSEILKKVYKTEIRVIETDTGPQKLRACIPQFKN